MSKARAGGAVSASERARGGFEAAGTGVGVTVGAGGVSVVGRTGTRRRWRRVAVAGVALGLLATAAPAWPGVGAAPHAGEGPAGARQAGGPSLAGCPMLPADDIWNTRVDDLPVHARSADWIQSIGAGTALHADFGAGLWNGGPIGIPFVVVPGSQPRVPVRFQYADESDPGPYPIPPDAPIEGGPGSTGDRHILVLDRDDCRLYETWSTYPEGAGWRAGSGAAFDVDRSDLRPDTWTSADAAGLPILPGLVRFDEVASGAIRHAVRFTAERTQRAYVWPARHFASSIRDPAVPPMGARLRLKAGVDLARFSPAARVILQGFKDYGLILADNGSNGFISGVPDERWDNDALRELKRVRGADFEVVDVSGLMIHPDSGQARQPGAGGVATATPPVPTATTPPAPTLAPTHEPTPSPQPSAPGTPSPAPSATPAATAAAPRWRVRLPWLSNAPRSRAQTG